MKLQPFFFFILQLLAAPKMLALVTEVKLFHHHFYSLEFGFENGTGEREGKKTEASLVQEVCLRRILRELYRI